MSEDWLVNSQSSLTLHHVLKMEQTQCSETSAFNTQAPGRYPEDNLSLLQHGERLKTRMMYIVSLTYRLLWTIRSQTAHEIIFFKICPSKNLTKRLSKFVSPTDAQLDSLKSNFKFALKLTLKSSYMFRCKTPSSGSALSEPC